MTQFYLLTCRNKRKLDHRQFLGHPDRSIASRMQGTDQLHGVLDMSWGFRSFHLIELHFDNNSLMQLILNRWVKLEVHSLSTRNLKSFLVLGLLPLVESLSVSNLFWVRSVVLRHIQKSIKWIDLIRNDNRKWNVLTFNSSCVSNCVTFSSSWTFLVSILFILASIFISNSSCHVVTAVEENFTQQAQKNNKKPIEKRDAILRLFSFNNDPIVRC